MLSTLKLRQRGIFDLDHTVIDSSHRQLTLADGSLDLEHWIANNTREKILADSLLPLANHWRNLKARGYEIVICTARVMGEHDLEFLAKNGLEYDALLSRPLGNNSPDSLLKWALLHDYANSIGTSWANFCARSVMFDDNQNVIEALTIKGLRVHNAISINKALEA
jgi:hypothetical protein